MFTETQKRINEIKARLVEATLGPWMINPSLDKYNRTWFTISNGEEPVAQICENPSSYDDSLSNAASDARFIAHAQNDIEFLLKHIQKLEAELSTKKLIQHHLEIAQA